LQLWFAPHAGHETGSLHGSVPDPHCHPSCEQVCGAHELELELDAAVEVDADVESALVEVVAVELALVELLPVPPVELPPVEERELLVAFPVPAPPAPIPDALECPPVPRAPPGPPFTNVGVVEHAAAPRTET
jgi:hypothetical protein